MYKRNEVSYIKEKSKDQQKVAAPLPKVPCHQMMDKYCMDVGKVHGAVRLRNEGVKM